MAQTQKPNWVSTGKYAEYEITIQSNIPDAPSGTIGTIRWEITSAYSDYAEVSYTVDVPPQYVDLLPLEVASGGTEEWYYSEDMGGLILGSTSLNSLAQGQTPYDMGSVTTEAKSAPAGTFDCYKISLSQSTPYGTITFNAWYDKATGVLVALTVAVQAQQYQATSTIQLKSTNAVTSTGGIMLGNDMMLWAIIAVVIIVVIVAIFSLSRRKKPMPTAPPPPPLQQ